MEKIKSLLEYEKAYDDMRKALMSVAIPDSAERICSIMKDLIAGKAKN
jgi:UDP-N-acetylglucosamine:LPS N-acetylglucosamine transferase